MNLKLYSSIGSPAVRSTLLTIHALDLEEIIEIIKVDLTKLDHFQPEFIQKNPLHTVPVLEDGDFILWDSHAINAYLVNKYAKNDLLYPKDPQKRALVDCMLQFHAGYIFAKSARLMKAVSQSDKSASIRNLKDLLKDFDTLELILTMHPYVAGDSLTIADFSIVTTFSTMEMKIPLNNEKHPYISEWYKKMKQLPYYRVN